MHTWEGGYFFEPPYHDKQQYSSAYPTVEDAYKGLLRHIESRWDSWKALF